MSVRNDRGYGSGQCDPHRRKSTIAPATTMACHPCGNAALPKQASLPQTSKRLLSVCCYILPAAGNFNGSSVNNVGTNGNYWSSTPNGTSNAYNFNFNSSNLNMNSNSQSNGFSVRLAQDYAPSGCLLEDLFQAYYCARRHKRNTYSQLRFESFLERNLVRLCQDLQNHSYQPQSSICFIVNEPVKREVFASSFRDRVVHHLYYNYVMPICERSFIFDSYSCRTGKGTLMGINRLEHHLRSATDNYSHEAFVLKLDLSGYFMSINRKALCNEMIMLLEKYRNRRAPDGRRWDQYLDYDLILYLTHVITEKDPLENCRVKGNLNEWQGLPPNKCLSHSPKGVGLPIGDLTSQLFSNVFLNRLDQFVKRELAVRHYGRYVDDFFLIHPDRHYLLVAKEKISALLFTMGLRLHPHKMVLQPAICPIEFLGCLFRPFYRSVSPRTHHAFNRYLRQEKNLAPEGLTSYVGYLRLFKTHHLLCYNLALPASINTCISPSKITNT